MSSQTVKQFLPARWLMGLVAAQAPDSYLHVEARRRVLRDGSAFLEYPFRQNLPCLSWEVEFDSWARIALEARNNEAEPCNVYLGMNPRFHVSAKAIERGLPVHFLSFALPFTGDYGHAARLAQLRFWHDCGIYPSIIIQSQSAFHVAWMLDRPIPPMLAEPTLHHVMLCSKADQMSRRTENLELPIPGFLWHGENRRAATLSLLYPENFEAGCSTYSPHTLVGFPPSQVKDIQAFMGAATGMPGDLMDNIATLARKSHEIMVEQNAQLLTNRLALEAYKKERRYNHKGNRPQVLETVPHITDIRWPDRKWKEWAERYCAFGWKDLSEYHKDMAADCLMVQAPRAEDLDGAVIRLLIQQGYTMQAIRSFWFRHGIVLGKGTTGDKFKEFYREEAKKAGVVIEKDFSQLKEEKDVRKMLE